MAKVDVMTMNGEQKKCLNLDYGVGTVPNNSPRALNIPDDVVVVQAMLCFIKRYSPGSPFSRAVGYSDLPEVSGTFDNLTANMIFVYQKLNAKDLLRIDGIVEAAAYKGRNIIMTEKNMRVLTITKLDIDCRMAAIDATHRVDDGLHLKMFKHEYPQQFQFVP